MRLPRGEQRGKFSHAGQQVDTFRPISGTKCSEVGAEAWTGASGSAKIDRMDHAARPAEDRFQDPGRTLDEITAEDVLVVCPACSGCARVVVVARSDAPVSSWPRRLVCPGCCLTRERPPGTPAWRWADGTEPFFALPLWLREPCCGRVLWALNEQHLQLLGDHVGARLRQRPREHAAPTSVLERLPSWITAADNRPAVLRAVGRLQRRIPRAGAAESG